MNVDLREYTCIGEYHAAFEQPQTFIYTPSQAPSHGETIGPGSLYQSGLWQKSVPGAPNPGRLQ